VQYSHPCHDASWAIIQCVLLKPLTTRTCLTTHNRNESCCERLAVKRRYNLTVTRYGGKYSIIEDKPVQSS
jgi:hypothetical protein